MSFRDFIYYVGEVIMYCQVIENDIKHIYDSMLNCDYKANFYNLLKEKMTLGQTIINLQELDYSDNDHFFNADDYEYLLKITSIRNHWAHSGYIKFIYLDNFPTSSEYEAESQRLKEDHDKLKEYYKIVNDTRKKAEKEYGRIIGSR